MFAALPLDVFWLIIDNLDFYAILRLQTVCKRFLSILSDNEFWFDVYVKSYTDFTERGIELDEEATPALFSAYLFLCGVSKEKETCVPGGNV